MLLDPGAKSASPFMMMPVSKEFNLNSLSHLEPTGRDINNGRAAFESLRDSFDEARVTNRNVGYVTTTLVHRLRQNDSLKYCTISLLRHSTNCA
jgi:hypothetical protein